MNASILTQRCFTTPSEMFVERGDLPDDTYPLRLIRRMLPSFHAHS